MSWRLKGRQEKDINIPLSTIQCIFFCQLLLELWERLQFGSSAIDYFNDLAHRMRAVSQDTRADMFLMQRLSVAMQCGNAACILGTIADDDFSTEFFV